MSKTHMIARCSCGNVEYEAIGTPITVVACYCDDCQEGSRQIDALGNALPVLEPDGGTTYVLYRKDRVKCLRGTGFLMNHKVKEKSATNRVVASCCNAAMLMKFDDARHWVPIYRARVQGHAPSLQMRICTKFKRENSAIPNDVPSHLGYPFKFMAKLVAAWIPMLLRR